ncbi:MAG: hypothetical protein HC854_13845, partial [Flavobacterium sp.]|nr:hypothetical protein [Flavobacterium sp.]
MIRSIILLLFIVTISCTKTNTTRFKKERIAFFNDILADTSQFQKTVYISKNGYFTKFEGFKSIESDDEDLSFDKLTRNQFLTSLFKEKDSLFF